MQGFRTDTDYSCVHAKMQRPVVAAASVESRILIDSIMLAPEDLSVFTAWRIFDRKTVLEGKNGRLIDRCGVGSKRSQKKLTAMGKVQFNTEVVPAGENLLKKMIRMT